MDNSALPISVATSSQPAPASPNGNNAATNGAFVDRATEPAGKPPPCKRSKKTTSAGKPPPCLKDWTLGKGTIFCFS
jgi:hypothetical protein